MLNLNDFVGLLDGLAPLSLSKLMIEKGDYDNSGVIVKCSNHDKGAITRKSCTNGCIGCGKCEKLCPSGAIKVENNLATIDYLLCTGCGKCADACPVKCIHK